MKLCGRERDISISSLKICYGKAYLRNTVTFLLVEQIKDTLLDYMYRFFIHTEKSLHFTLNHSGEIKDKQPESLEMSGGRVHTARHKSCVFIDSSLMLGIC